MNGRPSIVWDDDAKLAFRKAYEYIKEDSPQNASKVRKDILAAIGEIPSNTKRYPPDKYKIDNNGDYRAFEKHHLRVAYRITENEIRILSIRHTGMLPKEY